MLKKLILRWRYYTAMENQLVIIIIIITIRRSKIKCFQVLFKRCMIACDGKSQMGKGIEFQTYGVDRLKERYSNECSCGWLN